MACVTCMRCGVPGVPVLNPGRPARFCQPCRDVRQKEASAAWHQENRVAKRKPKFCVACSAGIPRGKAYRCKPCQAVVNKNRGRARKRDPEKGRGYCRAWYRWDPERSRVISANKTVRRKRRLRAVDSPGVSLEDWAERLRLFNGGCAYCDQPAEARDHVIPISRGGADDIFNVVPACKACNSAKGAKMPLDWAFDVAN